MICRSLQSLIRVRPKAGLATKAEQKDAHLKHELHNELEGPAKKGRSPTKMYWVDTESIFGGIVRYPPNGKNEIQVQERKKRLLQGAKAKLFFDETSALLFGPRVSKCPESLRSPYETEEADEQKEMVESISAGPGEDLGTLDQVATETEGRLVKPLSRPPKQVKISHETKISAYPTENSIKKLGKSSTKGMGRAKSDLDAEVKALPRLVTSVEEPRIAEGNVQKSTQSGSVRAAENIEVLSKRKKSKSQLRVVVLKNEADLKSLVQSPMMNKSRPNFRHDADGLTLPDSMVLKVSTEALTSLSLTLETFPSVTNILAVTMSPENRKRLDNWKNKKIEEIGLEEFKKYQQGLFDDGKSFHSAVETVLRGSDPKEVEVSGKNQGHWESLKNVFKDISDVITVEERISHPYLCYKGVTDCVLSLDGTPCLVEWKTSSTRKDTMDALYDNPLQVAAYIGAVNFDQKFEEKNVQLGMGAVVVAYSTGEPASVLVFDTNLLRKYWTQWLRRLQQYWQLAAAEKTLPRREK